MNLILSNVGGWLLRNWLPVVILVLVAGGYVYVQNLRSNLLESRAEIVSLEADVRSMKTELQQQEEAFKVLQGTFEDYTKTVDDYIKAVEESRVKDTENKDAVKDSGNDSDRNAPVDPYTREVLEKLCKLNPEYCPS